GGSVIKTNGAGQRDLSVSRKRRPAHGDPSTRSPARMRSIESPDPGDEPAVEETPLAGESPPTGACAGALPAAALAAPSAGKGVGIVPTPANSGDRAKLGPRA